MSLMTMTMTMMMMMIEWIIITKKGIYAYLLFFFIIYGLSYKKYNLIPIYLLINKIINITQ